MNVCKKLSLCLFLLASSISVFAQDGKIVETKPFAFTEKLIAERTKANAADKDVFAQINVREITYLSDGLKIKGFVAAPKNGKNLPVIIYNRGGNREFGMLNEFEIYWMAKYANWGYVVIGSQYRGCCGSEGKDEFGGADVRDVLNLFPALAQISEADPDRIGMWGWSRGGMMTFLALAQNVKIRAAVIGAPATNQFNSMKRRDGEGFEKAVFAELIPDYWKNKDAELKKRSPIFWTEKIPANIPILLMQGSADWRVAAQDNLDLMNKFHAEKKIVKFIFYPGGAHGLREYQVEVDEQTRGWFDKYVRDKSPLPDMELHGR